MESYDVDNIPVDYDTDTISLTSTVLENTEGKFDVVEGILADAVFGDGLRRWLVKWEGDPFKDCTWEPIESFEGTTLVEDWEQEKRQRWPCEDDYEDYIHPHVIGPHQAYKDARELRKQKRAKRRRKLLNSNLFPEDDGDGRQAPDTVISSDSDEDVPLANIRRKLSESDEDIPLIDMRRTTGDSRAVRETTSPLFVQENPSSRKPPLQQSSSDSSDSEAESDDYYMAQCSREAQKREARMTASGRRKSGPFTSNSTSAQATTKARLEGATQAKQTRPVLKPSKTTSAIPSAQERTTAIQPPAAKPGAASTTARISKPAMAPPPKPGPARNVREGSVAIRRSAPNSSLGPVRGPPPPIPMVNKPVNAVRRDRKDSGQMFTRLMQQHNFVKRSAQEKAPDPKALEFVGIGGAHATLPRQAAATPVEGRSNRAGDDLYGRREYRQRRVSIGDIDDPQQEGQADNADKIPVSCFEWRNGSCRRGDGCRFMHLTHHPITNKELQPSPADGSIPPKYRPLPLTCWYWMEEPSGCQYTADECQFAHRNTGMLGKPEGGHPTPIDPAQLPKSETHWKGGALKPKFRTPPWTCFHWLKRRNGCRNSDEECDFAHYNTGLLGIVGRKHPEEIDKRETPVSATAALHRVNPNMVPVAATRQPMQTEPALATRPEKDRQYSGGQLHRSSKDVTCHYWAHKGYCNKREEDCKYAHRETGVVARGPFDKSHDIIPTTPGETYDTTLERPLFTADTYRPDYSRHATAGQTSTHGNQGISPPADDPPMDIVPPQSNVADIEAARASSSVPVTQASEAFARPAPMMAAPAISQTLSLSQTLPPSPQPHMRPGVSTTQKPDPPTLLPLRTSPAPESTLSLEIPPHPAIPPSPREVEAPGSAMHTPLTPGPPKGPRERISCVEMNKKIEKACGLSFSTIFSHNDPTEAPLDRRAFFILNPDEHIEEIELLSRWLLMHHVAVYTLAVDGAWGHFVKEILERGGSGVIFAHPNFDRFWEINDFGHLLMMKRIRVWSVGWQMPPEFDQYDPSCEWTPPRYCCTEIFPHGGIIYITDNVFSETPIEALKIVQWFVNKVDAARTVNYGCTDSSKYVRDTYLLWRLAVRPELLQWTYDWCIANSSKIDSGDVNAQARLELYHLLSTCKYIEQDIPTCSEAECLIRPADYFPIISERAFTSEAYFSALQRSQDAANEVQVEMFAGTMIALRRSYRQFFVVHTAPQSVDWGDKWKNIDEVMTPVKCLRYIEEDGQRKGNRFEFFEWAFPKNEKKDVGTEHLGSEEGEVEDGDVDIVAMVSSVAMEREVSTGSNMSMDTSAS